jgi:hypothetical protein
MARVKLLTVLLRHHTTSRHLARAVICPERQIATTWWFDAHRLEHSFGTPGMWTGLQRELRTGVGRGPLPADSTVIELLLDRRQRRQLGARVMGLRSLELPHAVPVQTLLAWELRLGRG